MNWFRVRPIFNLAAFHCASKCVFNNTPSFIVRQTKITSSNVIITAQYSAQSETCEDFTEQLIMKICKDDPIRENKLRVIMMEIEVMRQDGRKAPENESIKQHHWEHILSLQSRSARYKYLTFLWKNEKKSENSKLKKEAKSKIFEEVKLQRAMEEPNENKNEMEYSLIKNSMFLRIYDSTMNTGYNQRLMQAMNFGEKLVVDCSYDKYMTLNEASNAGKQLTISFAENRFHEDPFDLHYCNCDQESVSIKQLYRNIPTIEEPWFPLHIHPESYLDLFPKEKLVYLTPHCREELTSFDPDAIYIIGCMVDKAISEPLSMGKAKEQNIKMAKLPLDRYLHWGSGSGKSLTINQVVKILLDLKVSGDWEYALRHVPRRKVFDGKSFGIKNEYSNTDRREMKPHWKSKFTATSNDYVKEEKGPRDNNYERKEKNLQTNDYGRRERGLNAYKSSERAIPFSNNYEKRETAPQPSGGYERGQQFSANNYERRERGSQSSGDHGRRERGSQFNENYERGDKGSQSSGDYGRRERSSQFNENYERGDKGSQSSRDYGRRERGSQFNENYERGDKGSQSSRDYGRRERGSQFNENYERGDKSSQPGGDYGRKDRAPQSNDVQTEKVHQKIPSGFQKRKLLTMRNLFDDTPK